MITEQEKEKSLFKLQENSKRNEVLLLSSLFIFTIAIRLLFIEQKNLWFDEIFSWHISLKSMTGIIAETSSDIHPPLYYFILKFWMYLFGDSMLAMRSLSVLSSAISFIFLYKFVTLILNKTESYLVMLLFCLSPLNVFYSQEVRMASLNLLFNIIAVYYFLKIVCEDKTLKKGIGNYLFFTLFSIFAIYTHYFSIFILISIILLFLTRFRALPKNTKIYLSITFVIIALSFIPWFQIFINHITKGQSWRYQQTLKQVIDNAFFFPKDITLGFYHRFMSVEQIVAYDYFIYPFTILSVLFLFYLLIKNKIYKRFKEYFIFLLVFIPVFVAIGISFKQWIEFFRYLSIIIPYILMIIIFGLRYVNKTLRIVLILLLLTMNLFGLYLYFNNDFKNNDYRGVLGYLNTNIKAGENVYVYPHYFGWIYDYSQKHDEKQLPERFDYGWRFTDLTNTIDKQNQNSFWLIYDRNIKDSLSTENDINSIEQTYKYHLSKIEFKILPNFVWLYRFERNK